MHVVYSILLCLSESQNSENRMSFSFLFFYGFSLAPLFPNFFFSFSGTHPHHITLQGCGSSNTPAHLLRYLPFLTHNEIAWIVRSFVLSKETGLKSKGKRDMMIKWCWKTKTKQPNQNWFQLSPVESWVCDLDFAERVFAASRRVSPTGRFHYFIPPQPGVVPPHIAMRVHTYNVEGSMKVLRTFTDLGKESGGGRREN